MEYYVKRNVLKPMKQVVSTTKLKDDNCNGDVKPISGDQEVFVGSVCPNCGARLEGRKCKLLCPTPNCGYMVTCSEW